VRTGIRSANVARSGVSSLQLGRRIRCRASGAGVRSANVARSGVSSLQLGGWVRCRASGAGVRSVDECVPWTGVHGRLLGRSHAPLDFICCLSAFGIGIAREAAPVTNIAAGVSRVETHTIGMRFALFHRTHVPSVVGVWVLALAGVTRARVGGPATVPARTSASLRPGEEAVSMATAARGTPGCDRREEGAKRQNC